MSPSEDQIDSSGGIADLIFDENNQERQSWRFCISRLPQSEVVHFTEVFVTLFLIVVPLLKLVIVDPDCEELTFCFAIFFLVQLDIILHIQNYD